MVVSFPSPSYATVNEANVVPVIDVGRLRQIMESVRRMSEGNGGGREGTGQQEQINEGRHSMPAEPESDIASSRSQSPDPHAAVERRRRASKGRKGASEKANVAHISGASQQQLSGRPEQSMTPEELYRAKVLVLDLLGWGVTPEYILQRGVSHELLCSIFSDLKLRLPDSIAADYAAIKSANTINRM